MSSYEYLCVGGCGELTNGSQYCCKTYCPAELVDDGEDTQGTSSSLLPFPKRKREDDDESAEAPAAKSPELRIMSVSEHEQRVLTEMTIQLRQILCPDQQPWSAAAKTLVRPFVTVDDLLATLQKLDSEWRWQQFERMAEYQDVHDMCEERKDDDLVWPVWLEIVKTHTCDDE
jgi:hypothetical protein